MMDRQNDRTKKNITPPAWLMFRDSWSPGWASVYIYANSGVYYIVLPIENYSVIFVWREHVFIWYELLMCHCSGDVERFACGCWRQRTEYFKDTNRRQQSCYFPQIKLRVWSDHAEHIARNSAVAQRTRDALSMSLKILLSHPKSFEILHCCVVRV